MSVSSTWKDKAGAPAAEAAAQLGVRSPARPEQPTEHSAQDTGTESEGTRGERESNTPGHLFSRSGNPRLRRTVGSPQKQGVTLRVADGWGGVTLTMVSVGELLTPDTLLHPVRYHMGQSGCGLGTAWPAG